MAPKEPLRTVRKRLLDANWTLFGTAGRTRRPHFNDLESAGWEHQFGLFHGRVMIDALSHSKVSEHSGNRKGIE